MGDAKNKDNNDNTGNASQSALIEEHHTGSMELDHATQFHADYYDDGITMVTVEDGLDYILAPDPDDLPDWLTEAETEGRAVIGVPAAPVYMAASSGMDLIAAIGALDAVSMTSTAAKDWAIPEIRELVESDAIHYIGKYRAPDYEAIVEEETGLAIESTMIYHSPQVKEAMEELGIPVLVERSSYEKDALGRLEWIKLYGLLFGKEQAAESYYKKAASRIASVDTDSIRETPSVAFFSVNSNGSVVVRKPGDYVTGMIETAGGRYALDGITDEEDNALSTMNMQMEAFYDMAVDADILIYNSAIESDLSSLSDLTALAAQFEDFKAVRDGNVWCTSRNVFQKTTGAADMIEEMNRIFAGADTGADGSSGENTADSTGNDSMEYFHKLK